MIWNKLNKSYTLYLRIKANSIIFYKSQYILDCAVKMKRVGFLGAGQMAQALAKGFINAGS